MRCVWHDISQEDAQNLIGPLLGQFNIEVEVLLACGYFRRDEIIDEEWLTGISYEEKLGVTEVIQDAHNPASFPFTCRFPQPAKETSPTIKTKFKGSLQENEHI